MSWITEEGGNKVHRVRAGERTKKLTRPALRDGSLAKGATFSAERARKHHVVVLELAWVGGKLCDILSHACCVARRRARENAGDSRLMLR